MLFFEYGQREIEYLSDRDHQLGEAISKIGKIEREINPDIFSALMKIIIGQQISTKAQASIWAKMNAHFSITPAEIAALTVEELHQLGLSIRKVDYMQGIARKIVTGELNLEALKNLDDKAVHDVLLPLKGIGAWSVEMLLIFSLQRPNILSFKDLGIIRGMKTLYQKEEISRDFFLRKQEIFSPFATVASLYLWEISTDSSFNR